jgi:hypothetical protein
MNKKLLYKKLDGSVGVVIPAPTFSGTIEELAQAVPEGLEYREIEDSDIPSDRLFRAAWCDVSAESKIDIDINKAQNIHLGRLRDIRNKKLKDLDIEVTIAVETGDSAKLAILRDKKQELRDMPDLIKVELESIVDIEQLKTYVPDMLKEDLADE